MKAEERYEEAEYFLEQMRKNSLGGKVFIYNLDAFLNAARSITFVLKKEFSTNPKFSAWYATKEEEMRKDDLMKFFVEMRNVSVKEYSPKTQTVTTLDVTETISISESVSITLVHPDGTKEEFGTKPSAMAQAGPPISNPVATIHCDYFFVQKTDNDVVTLCEMYLEKLSLLVMQAKKLLSS